MTDRLTVVVVCCAAAAAAVDGDYDVGGGWMVVEAFHTTDINKDPSKCNKMKRQTK